MARRGTRARARALDRSAARCDPCGRPRKARARRPRRRRAPRTGVAVGWHAQAGGDRPGTRARALARIPRRAILRPRPAHVGRARSPDHDARAHARPHGRRRHPRARQHLRDHRSLHPARPQLAQHPRVRRAPRSPDQRGAAGPALLPAPAGGRMTTPATNFKLGVFALAAAGALVADALALVAQVRELAGAAHGTLDRFDRLLDDTTRAQLPQHVATVLESTRSAIEGVHGWLPGASATTRDIGTLARNADRALEALRAKLEGGDAAGVATSLRATSEAFGELGRRGSESTGELAALFRHLSEAARALRA